ncbi:MAG TPA: RHS repeat domain-containing protein, partial [Longimicrobium sp.]|nr:RHS repeat domain-containing protein [Longimicrobium sp.]
MNRLLLAVPVAALLCIPAAARAQINGSLDVTPPVIQITPASQTISVDSVRVAVFWSDETMLDASSRIITLNGVNVTTSFTYTGTTKEATSVATLRLTAAGSYTVEASINDATGNPAAAVSRTYTYTPVTQPTQQVSVSPASQAVRRPLGFNTAESFTVANTGNTGATYTLQGLCSGSVANCSLTHTQVTVPAGASTAVGINYVPVGSAGATGTVSLKASNVANTAITATGTYNVTADTVATRGRQGMPTSRRRLDRDRCAVVSAGDGAALECGDLRLAHGLPPVRLLGRSRAPTLVYSSQHAAPHPVVVSYLQLTGTTRPDTVRGSLLVNGVVYSGKWPGWATDSLRRVAVGFDASTLGGGQSGIYPYTFTVTGTFNNGSPSVTLSSVSSELVVINRRASPFGAGWWLAGVEQILPVDTNRKLWVGGDGSYHVYTYVNDTTWAADSYDRPDTMKVRGNRLVRLLPGRAEVRYTLTGQHVETVDATGRVTTFVWRTDGPGLGSIVMPVAGYSYSFAYANNGGTRLSSVTAPGPAGAPLTTWVATDGSGRVSGITDPDANTVGYGYTGADWRVTSRTNRLNHTTRYTWGEGSKLTSVRIPAAVGDTLVTTFRAEEGQGVAFATSEFSTVVNGPRTDVNDVMFFVLDILGVPYRTNFPVRGDTYIYRTDSRYPGVVTRMDQPNGRIVTSSVDDRGNVIAVTDWSVTGGGRVATTLYEW